MISFCTHLRSKSSNWRMSWDVRSLFVRPAAYSSPTSAHTSAGRPGPPQMPDGQQPPELPEELKVGEVSVPGMALEADESGALAELAKTVTFTLPGDVGLVAGVTVQLEGFGGWDGKYIVTRAVHTVGGGGYTTQITIRKVLDY